MASEWRDLEQSFGRDANKLESGVRQSSSFAAILVIWLVFYGIAVAHELMFSRKAAPVVAADASQGPALSTSP